MLDATHSEAATLAAQIRAFPTSRDRVSLTLDALAELVDAEWRDLITALRDAREWEHDEDEAAYHFDLAAGAATKLYEDCLYHAANPGERV
ncbi:hypothetical protein [Amaricoccus solimangrovi]|uniref:Uncharacterized protein n=1 Tax=Amaricoccus solimangrovi TaxID=2589815 RepID=A0A501WXY3_9RHOB|nr:hypothetical protein [Amaricoccus solimangrovi]TPE53054.1 hypothetical protein FJM51_03240 [Amaricoccus solimangrovi]